MSACQFSCDKAENDRRSPNRNNSNVAKDNWFRIYSALVSTGCFVNCTKNIWRLDIGGWRDYCSPGSAIGSSYRILEFKSLQERKRILENLL